MFMKCWAFKMAKKQLTGVKVQGKTIQNLTMLLGPVPFEIKLYTPYDRTNKNTLHLGCPDCYAPVKQPRKCSGVHGELQSHQSPVKIFTDGETTVAVTEDDLTNLELPSASQFV